MRLLHWLGSYAIAETWFASSPYILMDHLLHWLRDWSNLFVALATFLYVLLTRSMLKALRHESTREHRLRHLQDIKEQVVGPTKDWVDTSLIPALRGALPLVSTGRVLRQANDGRDGEPIEVRSYELVRWCRLYDPNSLLFLHAQQEHFTAELRVVGTLVSDVKTFLDDCLTFAKACAEITAKHTVLPRLPSAAAGQGGFADSDFMIAVSLQGLLAGRDPELFEQVLPDGTIRLETDAGSQVARGEKGVVDSWKGRALQTVREEWARSSLGKIVRRLLVEAVLVSTLMKKLELTCDLRGDCEYVGREPRRVAAALRKVVNWRRGGRDAR